MAERTRLYPTVSCVTHAHRFSDVAAFDVPNEEYFAGTMTGIKVAWELLQAAEQKAFDDVEPGEAIRHVVEDAVRALDAPHDSSPGTLDKRGAAVGFLDAVCDVLAAAVQHWSFRSVLENQLQDCHGYYADQAKQIQAENEAFIASMDAGHASTRKVVVHG
ncbi:hypothetical protein D3C87_1409420 [compost metagenome]